MARITKQQAEDAATKMADAVYSKQVDEAENKVKAYAEKVMKKYIPAPILACFNEYPEWFCASSGIQYIHNGGYLRFASLPGKINPCSSKTLTVTAKEYEKLESLKSAKAEIKGSMSDFKKKVYEALVTLKTEKRIKETLPDALPYISFTNCTTLVPQYNELNIILKTLSKQDNDNH